MIFLVKTPKHCCDCPFGEEGGYCCFLTNGELCATNDLESSKPDWCPFNHQGHGITQCGVYAFDNFETLALHNSLLREENYYLELEINARQNSEYEKAQKYEKIAKVISNMRSRIID